MKSSQKLDKYKIIAFIVSIIFAISIGVAIYGFVNTYSAVGTILTLSFLIYVSTNKSYIAKREDFKAKLDARKAAEKK